MWVPRPWWVMTLFAFALAIFFIKGHAPNGEPADEPVRPAAESGTDPAASGDQAGSVDRWMCGRGTTDEQYSYAIQDPRLTDAASRKIT